MGIPILRKHAASPGKFNVWIEPQRGEEFVYPSEFGDVNEAKTFAYDLAGKDGAKTFASVTVYDDQGKFVYRLEPRHR